MNIEDHSSLGQNQNVGQRCLFEFESKDETVNTDSSVERLMSLTQDAKRTEWSGTDWQRPRTGQRTLRGQRPESEETSRGRKLTSDRNSSYKKTSGTGTAAETKKIAKGCNSVKKNDV
jgi:hypothetical protein